MIDLDDIKVRIRDTEGRYLAGDSAHPWFSTERTQARVFDYELDQVEATLALIARAEGLVLEAIPLDPQEFLEICDSCQKMMTTPMAFFDGEAFLCGGCKRQPTKRTRALY